MVNALEMYSGPFAALEQMVEEMDGTLSLIAYAGKHSDRRFINARVGSFVKKYGLWFSRVACYDLSPGMHLITDAYDIFTSLADDWYRGKPDARKEDAIDAHQALHGEPSDEFLESFEMNLEKFK